MSEIVHPQGHSPGDGETQLYGEELGPFSIPSEYVFEPELRDPTPRLIPESVHNSYGDTIRRKYARRCFIGGGIILGIGWFLIWMQWPQHFSPLRYLIWISLPFFVFGAWHVLRRKLGMGPYLYVQKGMPLVARLVELSKAPTIYVNGEPMAYAFMASIECIDPRSGQIFSTTVKSREFTQSRDYTTSFKVGDYLTAVYLPDQFPKSLQLYAFTDLDPHQGLVALPVLASAGRRWLKGLATALAVVVILAVLFWNICAFVLYLPIDLSWTMLLPLGIGSIVLGGSILAGVVFDHRRRQRQREEENRKALASGKAISVGHLSLWDQPGIMGWILRVLFVPGALLIGGLTVLCWAITVNAIFDVCPPQRKLVLVTKATVPAQGARFRHYAIEYMLPGSNEVREFHTVTKELGEVRIGPAEAEVCDGILGWPWIKAIHSPK